MQFINYHICAKGDTKCSSYLNILKHKNTSKCRLHVNVKYKIKKNNKNGNGNTSPNVDGLGPLVSQPATTSPHHHFSATSPHG